MVFNATFNNISAISWRSVLLVEETGGPRENHPPVASHRQILSHNVLHLAMIEIRTHNFRGDRHCVQLPSDHGPKVLRDLTSNRILSNAWSSITNVKLSDWIDSFLRVFMTKVHWDFMISNRIFSNVRSGATHNS